MAKGMHVTTGTKLETSYPENNLTGSYPKLPRAMYGFYPKYSLWPISIFGAMSNEENHLLQFFSILKLHVCVVLYLSLMLPAHFHDVAYDQIWSTILQEHTKSPAPNTRAIFGH